MLRVAILLKAALLAYREVNYDIDLLKIELQEDVLLLHQKLHSITTQKKRGVFPFHLAPDVRLQEAALATNQCTMAMALLGPMARKLLVGVSRYDNIFS